MSDARNKLIRHLFLLFATAVCLRLVWIGVRYAPDGVWARLQYPDEEAYVLSARSLAAGQGLIDEFGFRATYMPGYPAFLSLFRGDRSLLWARVIQAILAAWVAPATYLLAREFKRLRVEKKLPLDPPPPPKRSTDWTPLIAGALAAADPFLVFFSALLLTEALFAAVLVSAWALVLHLAAKHQRFSVLKHAFAAGLLLATVMLKPAAIALILAAIVAMPLIRRERSALASSFVLGLLFIAGLIPWAFRNHRVIGEYRWLTTRGGISLYDGVRADSTGDSNLAPTKSMPEVIGLTETQWDHFFQQRAREEIAQNPARIAQLALQKFRRTWSLQPNIADYRSGSAALISTVWMLFILISAAAGLWLTRCPIKAWFMLLLPVILSTATHMLFVGSVRYRIPVMPMLMVLSATALGKLILRSSPVPAATYREPTP